LECKAKEGEIDQRPSAVANHINSLIFLPKEKISLTNKISVLKTAATWDEAMKEEEERGKRAREPPAKDFEFLWSC
jgi:hypothetical protein